MLSLIFHFSLLIRGFDISSGSMLLIGSVGCHLTTLCRLALYLADIDIFKLDTSKTNGFLDGLRSAIRVTGAEGRFLFLCSKSDIKNLASTLLCHFLLEQFGIEFFFNFTNA